MKFLIHQVELSLQYISKNILINDIDISEQLEFGTPKFYRQIKTAQSSIWEKYFNSLSNKQNLNEIEQAVCTCHFIISDVNYLEEELLGNRNKYVEPPIISSLNVFFKNIFKEITLSFENMYFINSIRAKSSRFYSFGSDNNEFNYFISEFLKCSFSETETAFLEKWLQEYEIADKLEIEIIRGSGTQIYFIKDNQKINLVDLGYGVTQFLPILLKIIYCHNSGKRTIIIEEPESNLHPRFQSKLADLFTDAYYTFGISFILETHSEYLIRKMQILTARGIVSSEHSTIYYLGNPNETKRHNNEEQIRKINIDPNGRLTKPLGSGFYDEANNLSMELLDFSLN